MIVNYVLFIIPMFTCLKKWSKKVTISARSKRWLKKQLSNKNVSAFLFVTGGIVAISGALTVNIPALLIGTGLIVVGFIVVFIEQRYLVRDENEANSHVIVIESESQIIGNVIHV